MIYKTSKENRLKDKELDQQAEGTAISRIIEKAMAKKKLTIRKMAEELEVTYEHARCIARGLTIPSKRVLPKLSTLLGLDLRELGEAQVSAQIKKKYGDIPLEIAGKNPELEPIQQVWADLSTQHKCDLILMAKTFARLDRQQSTQS